MAGCLSLIIHIDIVQIQKMSIVNTVPRMHGLYAEPCSQFLLAKLAVTLMLLEHESSMCQQTKLMLLLLLLLL